MLTFTWFWRVWIVLPLRATYVQVTVVEFTKIRRQPLEFTLDKISNSRELNGISKLSIWSCASADHRNTFSFICVSCGACTQSYFAQALISGWYINLICFRIYDLFDLKKNHQYLQDISCANVYFFFILKVMFFFLIDCLDSPSKISTAILISLF